MIFIHFSKHTISIFKFVSTWKKRTTLYAIPDRLMWGIFMHVLICDDVKLDRCQGTHEF